MAKPTLVQTLLKQPSQTYVNVVETKPKQEYYSTKQEMLRIAASAQVAGEREKEKEVKGARTATQNLTTLAPTRYPSQRSESDDDDDSDLEVFFTPNTSPRTSMASSVATITFPSARRLNRRSLSNVSTESYQPMQLPIVDSPVTPVSKPSSSGPQAAVPSTRTPSTSTSQSTRARHALSSSSSLSSTSLEGHSVFSDFIDSNESTTFTTPYQNDSGEKLSKAKERPKASRTDSTNSTATADTKRRIAKNASIEVSTTNSASSNTPNNKTKGTNGHASNTPTPTKSSTTEKSITPASLSPSSSTKKAPTKSQTYTHVATGSRVEAQIKVSSSTPASAKGKEKEKDAQPEKTSTHSQSSSTSTSDSTSKSPRQPHTFSAFAPLPTSTPPSKPSTVQNENGAGPLNNPSSPATTTPKTTGRNGSLGKSPSKTQNSNASPTPPAQRKKPNHHKPPPSGMDAVLEEDEEGPFTPRMETLAINDQNDGYSWTSGSEGKEVNPSRTLRHTTPNDKGRDHLSTPSVDSTSTHSRSGSTSTLTTPTRQSRAFPKTLTSEVNALVYNSTGERPSNATQGYTSLVLPRAPPPASSKATGVRKGDGWLSADGKVDLTKSGVAQTTMATVEVVRGLGSKGGGLLGGFLGLGRKRSNSDPRGHAPRLAPPTVLGPPGTKQVLPRKPIDSTPLGFTSYRSPPNYVPSGSVLVQVWAVGVDSVDGRLVGVRFGGNPDMSRLYPGQDEDMHGQEMNMEEDNGGETEREDGNEDDMMNSNGGLDSPKKGALAALGRTLSMRLSRTGSVKQKTGKKDTPSHKRSVSAASTPSKTKQSEEKSQSRRDHAEAANSTPESGGPKRSLSFSLKRNNTTLSHATSTTSSTSPQGKSKKEKKNSLIKHMRADVGYIPGRSFVGRVLECGWDVREEVARKGDWVMGLLDVRRAGALAEFIVVDRRRVQRVPQPRSIQNTPSLSTINPDGLSLEELALLPLCGLPAYRAVRTFVYAFSSSSSRDKTTPSSADRVGFDLGAGHRSMSNSLSSYRAGSDHDVGYRRRALVLRGHDGAGAMAVQMLVRRGWRVSVHVPFSSVPGNATQEVGDQFMRVLEERARDWGADEVIFDDGEGGGGIDDGRGAAVRVLDSLREDGDIFDAVLDTIGGKEVREAAERLLRSTGVDTSAVDSPVRSPGHPKRRESGQFTTLVGDVPERAIPTAGDNFRAGLRSLRIGNDSNGREAIVEESADTKAKVGYAWVSVAQDVDWEGDDVGETLGIVLRQALEADIRPVVDDIDCTGPVPLQMTRTVPFEDTPYIFVDNGPLSDGGTVVVRIAA